MTKKQVQKTMLTITNSFCFLMFFISHASTEVLAGEEEGEEKQKDERMIEDEVPFFNKYFFPENNLAQNLNDLYEKTLAMRKNNDGTITKNSYTLLLEYFGKCPKQLSLLFGMETFSHVYKIVSVGEKIARIIRLQIEIHDDYVLPTSDKLEVVLEVALGMREIYKSNDTKYFDESNMKSLAELFNKYLLEEMYNEDVVSEWDKGKFLKFLLPSSCGIKLMLKENCDFVINEISAYSLAPESVSFRTLLLSLRSAVSVEAYSENQEYIRLLWILKHVESLTYQDILDESVRSEFIYEFLRINLQTQGSFCKEKSDEIVKNGQDTYLTQSDYPDACRIGYLFKGKWNEDFSKYICSGDYDVFGEENEASRMFEKFSKSPQQIKKCNKNQQALENVVNEILALRCRLTSAIKKNFMYEIANTKFLFQPTIIFSYRFSCCYYLKDICDTGKKYVMRTELAKQEELQAIFTSLFSSEQTYKKYLSSSLACENLSCLLSCSYLMPHTLNLFEGLSAEQCFKEVFTDNKIERTKDFFDTCIKTILFTGTGRKHFAHACRLADENYIELCRRKCIESEEETYRFEDICVMTNESTVRFVDDGDVVEVGSYTLLRYIVLVGWDDNDYKRLFGYQPNSSQTDKPLGSYRNSNKEMLYSRFFGDKTCTFISLDHVNLSNLVQGSFRDFYQHPDEKNIVYKVEEEERRSLFTSLRYGMRQLINDPIDKSYGKREIEYVWPEDFYKTTQRVFSVENLQGIQELLIKTLEVLRFITAETQNNIHKGFSMSQIKVLETYVKKADMKQL